MKKALENYSEIIFIHGIGTGKLKNELNKILAAHEHVASFDNTYDHRFGFGATEVELK